MNDQGDAPPRRRGLGFAAGIVVGATLTVSAAAYGASLGTISDGSIGTSANAMTACSAASLTYANLRTRFNTGTLRYDISEVDVNNVDVACRTSARVIVTNHVSTYDAIGNGNAAPNDGAWVGNFTALNNNPTWAAGQGPLLNNIFSSSNEVDFLVVIRS